MSPYMAISAINAQEMAPGDSPVQPRSTPSASGRGCLSPQSIASTTKGTAMKSPAKLASAKAPDCLSQALDDRRCMRTFREARGPAF